MNDHVAIAAVDAERLEIVRSHDRLAAVSPAWKELWTRVDGLIFQSPEWIAAWWDTVPDRDRRALRIGLIWNGEELVAVVPLAIGRRKGLRFLEWAAASVTDYGDILVAPECSAAALKRLWIELSASGGFDLIYLYHLQPDAAAHMMIAPESGEGARLRLNHREEVSHRVAGTWTSGKAWFDSRSKKTRKNYRHGLNVLGQEGTIQFRLLAPDEPLAPILDRLAMLKRKSLAEQGRESELFETEASQLAALVDVLSRAGVLHIFVIECNGTMIAVSINFVQHETMMAFVTTFDPDFGRASPGMILMMDYIRWSFDHGLTVVDFLCGAEAFKQRFATQSVTLQSFVGVRTLRGSLANFADHARRSFRTLQNRNQAAQPDAETEEVE
jgi:CelD/BcsL family acetyltransferase involved in cellulose biosynthesis